MSRRLFSLALVSFLPLVSQCRQRSFTDPLEAAATPAPPAFQEASWDEVASLADDFDKASLVTAAENGLRWLKSQNRITEFNFGVRVVSKDDMIRGYEKFLKIANGHKGTPQSLLQALRWHFDLVQSRGQDDGAGMLATGYYVPAIELRAQRSPGFEVPVYRTPDDVISATVAEFGNQCQTGTLRGKVEGGRFVPEAEGGVEARLSDFNATCATAKPLMGRLAGSTYVPYWTRNDIRTKGVLDNRGLEIGWVTDEVALFFVEVQGSASLETQGAPRRTLNYESANGRKYRSIGRLLVDEGRIPADRISMQTIRQYLAEASPEEVRRVLDYNESFVFFRVLDGGAHGCFDYEVTGGRSVALDQSVFPANAIGFLDVERPAVGPDGTLQPEGRINRIIFNQDTGGAIRGPGRVDLFWGSGAEEERLAGIMQSRGRLFLFVPKSSATQD